MAKNQINIIDSYAALPVGLWLQVLAVNADAAREEIDKQVGTIALLSGLSEREVLALPLADYRALASRTEFLASSPERLPRAASSYTAGRFVLVPALDLRKITTAQYVDFQTFVKEGDDRIVEILSVALVPKGAGYNDGSYDVAEVQDAIREDISVEQALSLSAFFFSKLARSIRSSLTYWSRRARREKDPAKVTAIAQKLQELTKHRETLLRIVGDGSPT